MRAVRGFGVREAVPAFLVSAACAGGAPPSPAVSTSPPRTSLAAATSATNAIATPTPIEAELPPEPGSLLDADVDPSVTVVGEELSYGGGPVGRIGHAQLPRTLARLRGKLDSARKHWSVKHQSAFPATLPIELSEQQRVLLFKELLRVATAAGFSNVELSVQSKGRTQRIRSSLRSPELQDSPRMTKRLHVTAAPKGRYSLAWKEGSTVVSFPYRELFAALPAGTDVPALLAEKINEEWLQNGSHRAAGDPFMDIAVLHLDDTLTLDSLLVVVKAIGTPMREAEVQAKAAKIPAFELFVFL